MISELPRRAAGSGAGAAGLPIQRLQIRLPAGTSRVTVLLLPDCDGSEPALPVAPLDDWLARRPLRLTRVVRRGCRARGLRTLPRRPAATRGDSKTDMFIIASTGRT
jgi:hypothetical protein